MIHMARDIQTSRFNTPPSFVASMSPLKALMLPKRHAQCKGKSIKDQP